jgi:hypothetical protein
LRAVSTSCVCAPERRRASSDSSCRAELHSDSIQTASIAIAARDGRLACVGDHEAGVGDRLANAGPAGARARVGRAARTMSGVECHNEPCTVGSDSTSSPEKKSGSMCTFTTRRAKQSSGSSPRLRLRRTLA